MTETGARYAWLPALVDEGVVVIAASRRLARTLRSAEADRQVAAGRLTWRTPEIHYWVDWLDRQLAEAPAPVPQKLDGLSAQMLWERAFGERLAEGLPGTSGIVRQGMDAWRRACDWGIDAGTLRTTARTPDERVFAAAAGDVADALARDNWTDGAGLPATVAALIETHPSMAPARLALAGFDRMSPSLHRVRTALERAGCRIDIVDAPCRRVSAVTVACDDEAAELRAAGAWARQRLDETPGATIGIVCAGLERRAATAGRLVREGFVPGWQFAGADPGTAVDVSYGRPLAEYPAIGAALLLLRWLGEPLAGRQVSVLLRSACWGGDESGTRARIELALREIPDRAWPVERFLEWLDTLADGAAAPRLRGALAAINDARREDRRRGLPACIRAIDALLEDVGWPGVKALSSEAFQLVNRWRELLNEFARAEVVSREMTLGEAGRRLASMAGDAIWQPEGEEGVVQVLGVLEAAGLEFDHVWVSGMDTAQWPPPPNPSPFLSTALQRDRDMPDATPANALAFARRVLTRISGSSSHCVFSWARVRDDTEMAPSTLLEEMGADAVAGQADPGWFAARLVGHPGMALIADDNARPVLAGERVRGGAYTIQRQFTEPLSALVSGRLGVRRPAPFRAGLSAGDRGSLLHDALHNLFSGKPSRTELAGWSDAHRERRIGSAVDAALGNYPVHPDRVLARLLGLERERLRRVLASCLDWEVGRDTEFEIVAVEEDIAYNAHGIAVDLRVDRVDRLGDGRLVIIDYKTGTPKSFVHKDNTLSDVQPVLYAAAIGAREPGDAGNIGALLFQNIDSRKIGYSGAGPAYREKDEDGWPGRIAGWLVEVDDAIAALAGGDARINVCQSAADGRALAILSRLEEQRRAR